MLPDYGFVDLLSSCVNYGTKLQTRNSVCTRIIHQTVSFVSTPLVSLRKTSWLNALREWEWFMSGSTNIADLHPAVHAWWKPWADEYGKVNYNYSWQMRRFNGYHDQIEQLVDGIKNHPFSRRNIMTTWNPVDMADIQCLITNCHGTHTQAFVDNQKRLTLTTYQRSCDLVCGVPHNWIQYWAFLLWLAHATGTEPYELIWTGGDVHVYESHMPVVERLLKLASVATERDTPQLVYKPTSEKFLASDFSLDSPYIPLNSEKVEMVV